MCICSSAQCSCCGFRSGAFVGSAPFTNMAHECVHQIHSTVTDICYIDRLCVIYATICAQRIECRSIIMRAQLGKRLLLFMFVVVNPFRTFAAMGSLFCVKWWVVYVSTMRALVLVQVPIMLADMSDMLASAIPVFCACLLACMRA